MFNLIKKVTMILLITMAQSKNCFLLNDQKCGGKKVIVDNDYMTFPYKTKVDRCVGSCNNITNPHSKVCVPNIVKNISVKVFDLISQQNELRGIEFHESCKCNCLLNETVCNDKQKWNKNKCRWECLKIEECDNTFFWNIFNCRFEHKKTAKLIAEKHVMKLLMMF